MHHVGIFKYGQFMMHGQRNIKLNPIYLYKPNYSSTKRQSNPHGATKQNCGVVSASPTVIMQRSQYKIVRAKTNAPRYVTNHTVHTDVPYVSDVIHERINKHHNKLSANEREESVIKQHN